MHPDMWYHLNAIHHHGGCRLVHPSKWDISSMPYAIMTDVDWCIPSGGSFSISIQFKIQELTDSFTIRFIIHIHSVFKYHISIPYSLSYYLFKDILNLCTHFIYSFTYSFHTLIHVLISYTHSCTHFIYSFMYSFHILIHVLISYTHSCTHFIFTW